MEASTADPVVPVVAHLKTEVEDRELAVKVILVVVLHRQILAVVAVVHLRLVLLVVLVVMVAVVQQTLSQELQ
jgi:hypothetical protein